MKKLLAVLVVLAFASFASADIIGWNCSPDGDGAIEMTYGQLISGAEYTLDMDGIQHWGPAHMNGEFITDTELDPTVWINQEVENDTNFVWTDYHIAIGMNKVFTIGSIAVVPADWTYTITAPVGGQLLPNGQIGWLGFVDYYAGTPIQIGQVGTFGLKASFVGTVQFCTEQYPTPEPATMSLLGLGALLLRRRSA
jgi:hypothetical protein